MGWTPTTATKYLKKLATEASSYGMGCGLKNALPILSQVKDVVQFAVNEECSMATDAAHKCDQYWDFLNVDKKPVFHVEYPSNNGALQDTPAFCLNDDSYRMKFSTLIGDKHLTGPGKFCGQPAFRTPVVEGEEGR